MAPSAEQRVRLHLLGYYGYGNLGDDLMLDRLMRAFASSDRVGRIDVSSVSSNIPVHGNDTHVLAAGGWRGRFSKAVSIARSDVVVWGGGTCLYEDGPGGTAGLRGIARVIKLTRATGGRYVLLGVGVGTIHTTEGRRLLADIVKGSSTIHCRDDSSREIVDGLREPGFAFAGGDLALLGWSPHEGARPSRDRLRHVVFCGTRDLASRPELVAAYRADIQDWIDSGVERVTFLPFHQGERSDDQFHEMLAEGLPSGRVAFAKWSSPSDAESVIKSADLVVAIRLHASVMSCMLGVPCLAIAYSPKVNAFMARTGLPESDVVRGLGARVARSDLEAAWNTHRSHDLTEFLRRESAQAESSVRHFLEVDCRG